LRSHLLDHVGVGRYHLLEADADDLDGMTRAYGAQLTRAPIDLICMGIGENGHVAFNDPPVADFEDPVAVKVIALDPVCRQQQVNDCCFSSLEEVPKMAVTITVPVFLRARALSCVVPNKRKAQAVRCTLEDPIGPACPSTLLRRHANARLFLDPDSFGDLSENSFTRV
jgi:glucosamine-6-phosphate deaminase